MSCIDLDMSRRIQRLGVALAVIAALWLALSGITLAQIEHGGPAPTRTPDLGPSPTPIPGATPTIDRLAPPPTVVNPNQADEGKYLFWLHCMPCHGDQGQGLTDEFRTLYPPQDQYCWNSGCHGNRPYGQGFQLPTAVPAIIGDDSLAKFETMDAVYRYASVAMPYFYPGTLTQEEYLAILAHIAREDGLWDGTELTMDNLAGVRLHPAAAETGVPDSDPAQGTVAAVAPEPVARVGLAELLFILGAILALLFVGGLLLWRRCTR